MALSTRAIDDRLTRYTFDSSSENELECLAEVWQRP
jgi:hypothetical protein